MALHARLFTHNILRVSKIKKWSHTTQAIDRNGEKSAIACCPQTTNAIAEEGKVREADTAATDLPQLPFSAPWSHPPFCLESILPSCHPPTHKEGRISLTPQPTPEKSLTAMILPQDYLPLVVKSVSYTTDDIMACPVDRKNHDVDRSAVYENHPVTMLTECAIGLKRQCSAARDTTPKKGLCSSGEKDASVLHTSRFRRHSVCDSNPTRHQPHSTDSVLQCGEQSGKDTVFCSPASDPDAALRCSQSGSDVPQGSGEGPNMDQLRAVETFFIDMLPKFFKSRLDYSVYHPEIVFENNFWGENQVSVGINQYAVQLTKLRVLTHLKYAHVHMEVISSKCLKEEGAIHIRWRIIGLSQFKALRFWKYTAWSYSKAFREDAEWVDGISVLHVNKDGLVTKHRLDRVTPSEEVSKAPSLAAKLALVFGLSAPKPSLPDFSFLCRQ